ncbi:hypothetical protein BGZ65_002955, partial [Modicella reniformis]
MLVGPPKPLKRLKAETPAKDTTEGLQSNDNVGSAVGAANRSFMDDMPVSPPDSPALAAALLASAQDDIVERLTSQTPPSEALKRLERMNSGRSHEDGSGTKRPRCLETIRGSSTVSYQSLENEFDGPDGPDVPDDLDQPEPASPTKRLVDRHKGITQHHQDLSRHRNAGEISNATRRRGRTRTTINPSSSFPAQFSSPSNCREDVLKMIEQMNANMTESSQSELFDNEEIPDSRKTHIDVKEAVSTFTTSAQREGEYSCHTGYPTASDIISRTCSQTVASLTRSSPDEFDLFFTDLEMDEQDLEELTQFERSSTSMGSVSSGMNSTLCPSSSAETCSSSSSSHVRRELSDLEVRTTLHGLRTSDSFKPSSPVLATPSKKDGPSDDNFDDFGDFEIEGDTDNNETSPLARIDSTKYRRFQVTKVQENMVDKRWKGIIKILEAQEVRSENPFSIILCESWLDSQVNAGDIIHVIGGFIEGSELMVNNAQGFLIVKPDVLIPTSVLS